MPTHTTEVSADLPCHACRYDLRAHPADGSCPECGASVAESRRLATLPRRPAWRDSDPRWRRRMLAGVWILALMPLMEFMRASELAERVPVPRVIEVRGSVRTLDDTLAADPWLYPPVAFCAGVVLLFSLERGRRPRARLDWMRRWGVGCSYVVALLSAAHVLFIIALVMTGVGAVFQSISLKYQPAETQTIVNVSTTYLRYGALPANLSIAVLVAFSSITVLLACVPLYDALHSTGVRRLALVLLAPLAAFAVMHIAQAAWYCLNSGTTTTWSELFRYGAYFSPLSLAPLIGKPPWLTQSRFVLVVEVTKWFTVLAIASWLSVAQVGTWRSNNKSLANT